MAADPGLPLTFAAQVLHALSFAATHVATVNLLGGALPPRFAALAQGAYSTLLGAVNGAAFLAAGPLYAALGGRSFAVMALVAAVATALVLAGLHARRAQPQSVGEGGKTREPS
jgi:PPP family 3-phenylpropionic acid transporter